MEAAAAETVKHKPYVAAERTLPELTAKAILLGAGLAIVLGAANMYVGLRVGLTVSASIPASVISMGILRAFRNSNILENNIVQTFAASGEAVAAGIIFTIPALLLTTSGGVPLWSSVNVWDTLLIALVGGVLGVLFTVPLRRAFIVETSLTFPEGVACAEVLQTGEKKGRGVRVLASGLIVAGAYNLMESGLHLWGDTIAGARRVGDTVVAMGTSLSPLLLAVGYIIGLRISMLILAGGLIAWFVLIPLLMTVGVPGFIAAVGYPGGDPLTAGLTVWTHDIRLVGGGAMVTGGLYTLWKTRASLAKAFQSRGSKGAADGARPRTERDLNIKVVVIAAALLMIPVFILYYYFTQNLVQALAASALMGVAGFFFSAVAGYMAGVVGSSNNPISGVTILTLLTASLLLLVLGATGAQGMLAALAVGAVICCAGAMAGDTLQDLKTGWIVGSTPWKQQTAQILGVIAFAAVSPFVLQLLVNAYGFATPTNVNGLQAPQAFLMSQILQGIFGHTLDWNLVILGMAIGVILAILRLPVMAVAVGIYLPLTLDVPIGIGGILAWIVERRATSLLERKNKVDEVEVLTRAPDSRADRMRQNGLLFASGLIAGEAIMGILLAAITPFEPTAADGTLEHIITVRLVPILIAVLVASAILLFGERLGRWRIALSAAVCLLGAAVSAYMGYIAYDSTFQSSADWPGLLLLAYIGFLIVYVPWREAWIHEEEAAPATPPETPPEMPSAPDFGVAEPAP
ncbi:MAG: OPT family oligopeptide transporter [Thermoplasmatota archaeon]